MKHLYDFGISQDDPQLELEALSLSNSNLLCIASAGEVPLSILARENIQIKAVDQSINQIMLCRLKLNSILHFEPLEAAAFLGFKKSPAITRRKYFQHISPFLDNEERLFWKKNIGYVEKGVINCSRFEQYISFFCGMARAIMGREKLLKMMHLDSIPEQEEYFDRNLDKKILKWIFRIVFSPVLYKNRGLDPQGLKHRKENMANKFYARFRDFFTATPASKNFYLQFYMLGEVLYQEALPSYLNKDLYQGLRQRKDQIEFHHGKIQEQILEPHELKYKNYALSNISDWLDETQMNLLLEQITDKTSLDCSILLRYIHKNPVNDSISVLFDRADEELGKSLKYLDRFPFYSLVKLKIHSKIGI